MTLAKPTVFIDHIFPIVARDCGCIPGVAFPHHGVSSASEREAAQWIISHELPLAETESGYQHFDARNDGWTKVVLHESRPGSTELLFTDCDDLSQREFSFCMRRGSVDVPQ
ncbi:hypothetical protein [Rhodococcus sp. 1139]|uniref:hypothetical protein n=1 Tax=Rhodococcus sp. 1139 TaxID=1833762 RepID=UPI000871B86E|nr:hypothetical protein [Rhodococcus sp. 1139]OFE10693.1 hypothetical protein A5N83_01305 [Rhodococcus sp. 1139]